MKNLFIIVVIVFLSCKKTEASDKNRVNSTLNTEVVTKTVKGNFIIESEEKNIQSNDTKTILYKGTIDGTIKISLFINEQASPCGGNKTILNAMYKYDNQKKWILLNSTRNRKNTNYAMVEDNFSGALFLKTEGTSFNGVWLSPDAKKQFNVIVEKVEIDGTTAEELDEILFDDLIHSKNDC